MASNLDRKELPNFVLSGETSSVGPQWKRWKRAFEFYIVGKGITGSARKKALMLHMAGMEVQDLYETLKKPTDIEGEPTLDESKSCESTG